MGVDPTLDQEAGRATVLKTARPTGTRSPPWVRASFYQVVEPYRHDAMDSNLFGLGGAQPSPGRNDAGVWSVGCAGGDAGDGRPVRSGAGYVTGGLPGG